MDALVAAALEAAGGRDAVSEGNPVRVVLVPAAVARHRPELAARHGRAAFLEAGERAGIATRVDVAWLTDRAAAADEAAATLLRDAHLVHLPGGDPDLVPEILAGTRAWAAAVGAYDGGACLAGASAGAMALCERLWTANGLMDGLAVVPDTAVVPHWSPARLESWRSVVDPRRRLTWLGLDEQTVVVGRPGEPWTVAGRGRAYVVPPGSTRPVHSAGSGERIGLGR